MILERFLVQVLGVLCLCCTTVAFASDLEHPSKDIVLLVDYKSFIDNVEKNVTGEGVLEASYIELFAKTGTPKMALYPYERGLLLMETDYPYCMPFKLKTDERQRRYQFSYPLHVFQAQRLYQMHNAPEIDRALLTPDGKVRSLASTIMSSGPLLLMENRTYGKYLDSELENISENRLYLLSGRDPLSGIINMSQKGRIDFVLLYPTLANRVKQIMPIREYQLANIPPFFIGYIMCNRHPDATRFLEKVNNVLIDSYSNNRFLSTQHRYMTDIDFTELSAFFDDVLKTYQD